MRHGPHNEAQASATIKRPKKDLRASTHSGQPVAPHRRQTGHGHVQNRSTLRNRKRTHLRRHLRETVALKNSCTVSNHQSVDARMDRYPTPDGPLHDSKRGEVSLTRPYSRSEDLRAPVRSVDATRFGSKGGDTA